MEAYPSTLCYEWPTLHLVRRRIIKHKYSDVHGEQSHAAHVKRRQLGGGKLGGNVLIHVLASFIRAGHQLVQPLPE